MLWGVSSADLVLSNVYNFFLNLCRRLIREHSSRKKSNQLPHLVQFHHTNPSLHNKDRTDLFESKTLHPGSLRSLGLLCLFHGKKNGKNKNTSKKQDRLSQTIPSPTKPFLLIPTKKKDKNTKKTETWDVCGDLPPSIYHSCT